MIVHKLLQIYNVCTLMENSHHALHLLLWTHLIFLDCLTEPDWTTADLHREWEVFKIKDSIDPVP